MMPEPDRSNHPSFYDPEWGLPTVDEEAIEEERLERLDQEKDRVLAEINEGRHDDELLNSPFVDLLGVMRLARAHADTDLWLQIDDYARDAAERRLLR